MAVYDDEKTNTEDLHKTTGIGKDEMRDMEARAHAGADQDRATQADGLEKSFAGRSAGDDDLPPGHPDRSSSSPSDTVGQGYNENDTSGGSRISRIKGKFTKKRSITGLLVGGVVGGGMFGFSILQGPMQFVQFAQFLQNTHFSPVEDFGDDRGFKTLVYGLAGTAERGRLSAVGNRAADVWEKKLLDRTGLKPAYHARTGRLIGFEISNSSKFQDFIGGLDEKNHTKLTNAFGDGSEIVDAKDIGHGVRNKDGAVSNNTKIIQFEDKFKVRRLIVKTISNATGHNKLVSTMGSRLMKKRGGIDFHPLKNIFRNQNDKLEFRAKVVKERVKQFREGLNGSSTKTADTKNDEVEKSKEELSKGESEGKDTTKLRKTLAKGFGPVAVAGIYCAAKGFGDDIPGYKYTNSVLPMMRMGMNTITAGNQVMAGQDVNMDELSVYNEFFYDEETNTSWMQAESIKAQNGESGGIPPPKEASLKQVNDKPWFFDVLSSPPLGPALSPVCAAFDAVGGLVPGFVDDAISAVINLPLGAVGTSTDDLTEMAFGAVAGKSVNVNATGAEFGNLADTGAFLAANDNAVTMGGRALTQAETVALKTESRALEDNTKSIAARYLDPYDINSLLGSVIASSPRSLSQFIDTGAKPLKSVGNIFSNIASLLTPGSYASSGSYDYGVPKYGFSLEEQQDERFENPYENAAIVEPRLDELNDKYGECFSMKINTESSELVIESGEAANVFEIKDKAECRENSEDFLRYRFYLADAMTASSLACFEASDDTACANIGINSTSTNDSQPNAEGFLVSGDDKEIARKILDSGKVTGDSRYMPQIEAYANGNNDCHINSMVLKLILTISQNHSIYITSLNRLCTGVLTDSGESSYHYREKGGHAFDIGIVDGVSSTGATSNDIKLLKSILPLLPSGSGIGQSTCGRSGLSLPEGVTEFYDTCNHIHIQVPVD